MLLVFFYKARAQTTEQYFTRSGSAGVAKTHVLWRQSVLNVTRYALTAAMRRDGSQSDNPGGYRRH
jgi:hypothetical protein